MVTGLETTNDATKPVIEGAADGTLVVGAGIGLREGFGVT